MQYTISFLIFLFSYLFTTTAYGQDQNHITGEVTDVSGNPIYGATIILKEISRGVVTDENGRFSLPHDDNGILTLETSFLGFLTDTRKINFTEGNSEPIQIILQESSVELNTVNLSAKSQIQKIEALAFNVDVVDAEKLHNTTLDVGHALDRVSGIRVRESGGVGSRMQLSMNGFRGNQVKIFIDGVPMENFGSSFQLNNIPISIARRIEVYKGVVPVGLGADALGGAINIVTNTYEKDHLDVSYSYGSFNTHRTNVDATLVSESGLVGHVNFYQNYSDNDYKIEVEASDLETGKYYPEAKIRRFHDLYRNETLIGHIGVVDKPYADKFLLGITLGQVYDEIQNGQRIRIVYGERHARSQIIMPSLTYQKKDFIIQGLDVNINANYNLGNEQTIDTVNRDYNWLGQYIQREGPGGEAGYSHLVYKNRNGIASGNVNYEIDDEQSLSVSNVYSFFDRKRKDKINPDNDRYDQPQQTYKNVAGLSYRYKTEDWSGTIFTKNYNQEVIFEDSYNPTGYYGDVAYFIKTNQFNFFGYGLAGSYFFTENIQFKASFEKAYRLPSPRELFGDGGVTLEGNPHLEPEVSYNYNLGATVWTNFNWDQQLQLQGNFFYRDSKNFIQEGINTVDIYNVMTNLGAVTSIGIEAEALYSFKDKFNAGFNLTYQDVRNNAKTTIVNDKVVDNMFYRDRIPNLPYFYSNANAGYNFHNILMTGNTLNLRYNLLYVHAFYLYWPSRGAIETKHNVPEQISHDLSVSYAFGKEQRFQLTLEANNITNNNRYDNFSLPKPGRNFSGKIRYSF